MKNKKGFTLIELLAVIVILAIIALIATPIILNIVEKARKSAFQDGAYGLIEAAKLQYVEGILDGTSGATEYDFGGTTGANLKFSGSAPTGGKVIVDSNGNVGLAIHDNNWCALKGTTESEVRMVKYDASTCIVPDVAKYPTIKLYDEENKEITIKKGTTYTDAGAVATTVDGLDSLSVTVSIKRDGVSIPETTIDTNVVGKYTITYTATNSGQTASIERTVNVVDYLVGEEVTFDPGDGMRTWNVIKDAGDTVTLMMNENLGDTVAWQSSNNNAEGPVTALETLNTRTSTWTNVPVISNYEYINNAGGNTYTHGYQKLRIVAGKAYVTALNGTESLISSTEDTATGNGTLRARLITGQEAAIIMNDTAWNQVNPTENAYAPDWMKAHLVSSVPAGYWTLSSRTDSSSFVWYIYYLGFLDYYAAAQNSTFRGIRPVIEIPKTAL